MLLRVVRDFHTKETWLYLIADKPDFYANVLIKPFGEEKEYLTDEKGRVNLGKINWPEPDKLAAEVRLPRATFSLEPIKDLYEDENSVELKSPAGDRIKVTFSGEGRHRRLDIQILNISGLEETAELKIAVKGKGMVKLIQLKPEHSNRATFEDVEQPEGLEIYLY